MYKYLGNMRWKMYKYLENIKMKNYVRGLWMGEISEGRRE